MTDNVTHIAPFHRNGPASSDRQPWDFAANTDPYLRDLLTSNGALSAQNQQLKVSLAQRQEGVVITMARLTPRQRQVMALVLDGQASKNIAADLRISQRTVENHRAAIMRRTGATSLPALTRLSLGFA